MFKFVKSVAFPSLDLLRTIMATYTSFKDRNLLAVIGDEVHVNSLSRNDINLRSFQDSITGLLLAGVGHINENQKKNFLVVDSSMHLLYAT